MNNGHVGRCDFPPLKYTFSWNGISENADQKKKRLQRKPSSTFVVLSGVTHGFMADKFTFYDLSPYYM